MLQAYFEEGMSETAVFSLFVRRLSARCNYLLACGLDDALRLLETLRFDQPALAYLESPGRFSQRFLQYLERLRFTGDVYAIAEGTPVFANEPVLEVEGPIAEAELVEAMVMNQVHLQTVLASKAARVVGAALGRRIVDFGLRRMHGIDAGLKAANLAAGVHATSNLAAGQAYGLEVAGIYATEDLVRGMDAKVHEQVANVAALPGIVRASYAMPEAHWGYGFPIDGVAAFDADRGGVVSAGGVGFDISCGVRLLHTGLTLTEFAPLKTRAADELSRSVPAGVGSSGRLHLDEPETEAMLAGGARWAVARGYGSQDDLQRIEDQGCMSGAAPAEVSHRAKDRQRWRLTQVVDAADRAGLSRKVARLEPLVCIKG